MQMPWTLLSRQWSLPDRSSRNNGVAILGLLSVDGWSGDDTRDDIAAINDINGQGRLVSTSFEEEEFVQGDSLEVEI